MGMNTNPALPNEGARPPQASTGALAAACAVKRVLLAEDDDEVRELLAQVLRINGYEVIEVTGGLELYNRLGECLFEGAVAPDVIVSDLRMPDFSGLEVLHSVRAAELDIPFILMTAYGDAPKRAAAIRDGALVVLDKPFELEELLDAVARSASIGDAGRPR